MALASLGLLVIGAIPTVIGVAEAIDAQKKQNQQAKERIKFTMTAKFSVDKDAPVEQATVILQDGYLFLDHPAHPISGYKFNGFYFGYPGPENHQGLVSLASDDPPALHWIFGDNETGRLRHGKRSDTIISETEHHLVGPWNWSEDEEWLVLENSPYFLAVEGGDGAWSVYYDKNKNLKESLAPLKVVEISLHRELQLGVSSRMTRD
ncbi:hypothetical protein BJ170DRAFT_290260 [Xylariales sp. AK1849]|nr:hypothetical protein BJ170DRAFT_290260 [Xylariales sp. AK1849]